MRVLSTIPILAIWLASTVVAAETAAEALIRRANAGDLQAQTTLGSYAVHGITEFPDGSRITENHELAEQYLLKSAMANDAAAQMLLASLYFKDAKSLRNYGKASDWYQAFLGSVEREVAKEIANGANARDLTAQLAEPVSEANYRLGVIYLQECSRIYVSLEDCAVPFIAGGFLKDAKRAVKYFELAADAGHREAMLTLGEMSERGIGKPQNFETAAKWYSSAADRNHEAAPRALGLLYQSAGDPINAHMWFNIGGLEAQRDALAATMSTAEVAEAQRRAERWASRKSAAVPAFRANGR